MIDNTGKKELTRFVVVREFTGVQSMEDAFGALVERQAGDSYERWRSDHAGSQKSPPIYPAAADKGTGDDVDHSVENTVTPVPVRAIQTA